MTWGDWSQFAGNPAALKWNRRDLPAFDQVIARCVQRRIAVQAGGHYGLFPKRLAESFKAVYTFEPSAEMFAAMWTNAPERNIVRFQAAVGEVRGLVGLSQTRRDGTTKPSHQGLTHVDGTGRVPVLRIDDLGLPVCDLLALDLEGFELYALRGARDTLARCRPLVAVEVNQNAAHYGYGSTEVHALMAEAGYTCVDRQAQDDVFAPVERAA